MSSALGTASHPHPPAPGTILAGSSSAWKLSSRRSLWQMSVLCHLGLYGWAPAILILITRSPELKHKGMDEGSYPSEVPNTACLYTESTWCVLFCKRRCFILCTSYITSVESTQSWHKCIFYNLMNALLSFHSEILKLHTFKAIGNSPAISATRSCFHIFYSVSSNRTYLITSKISSHSTLL